MKCHHFGPALAKLPHLSPSRLIFAHKIILPIDVEVLIISNVQCAYESASHFSFLSGPVMRKCPLTGFLITSSALSSAVNIAWAPGPV